MRCLVDTGERNERVPRSASAESPGNFFSDAAVYREPATDVATKVSNGRARHETGSLPDALATTQTTRDDAQRPETGFGELENRGGCAVDVAIDESHLRAYIAS